MRLLAIFLALLILSGCTAMLVSGSATTGAQTECEKGDTKDQKREC